MSTARYHALVVDDEPDQRKLTAVVFRLAGFDCDLAASGRQALRLLGLQSYDVIVTDLRMPDINGHQVAVELLDKPQRPVVIVVTGVDEPRIERDLRIRGVDELLFKPVDYPGLAARAKTLIERRATLKTFPPTPKRTTHAAGKPRRIDPATTSESPAEQDGNSASLSSLPASRTCAGDESGSWVMDQIDRLDRFVTQLRQVAGERNLRWIGFFVTFQAGMLVGWLLAR